ncbi:MAG: c-type cytochrome [Bacteroidales bacterium]
MMKYLTKVKIVVVFIMAVIFTAACHRDNNHPGYDYLPEMDISRAYEAYSENPVFKDGKTMQPPVKGTVARGKVPYPYTKDDEDQQLAGQTIFNPLEYTRENLERGEVSYNRFCINCHGSKGDGKGNLFTSGVYKFPPSDLTLEAIRNQPDGELYHVITVGKGIMGAHGPQIRPDDRWKIIMYVREELQKPL